MRLTVGPLPAAVYWRRRAVVLVGLAMVILVVSYACNAPDVSTAALDDGQISSPTQAATTPSPTSTLKRPTIASPSPTTQPAFTLPAGGGTGPCTDPELRVTSNAGKAEIPHGQSISVPLSIKIKNISDRKCSRDIGADVQELRVLDPNDRIVWSSDDCDANKGRDVRSFDPGREVTFTRTWNGERSRSGTGAVDCDAGSVSRGVVYRLVARLDQILSAPFEIRIES